MSAITGRVVDIDGKPNLVLTRRFAASVDEIWRELTDSDRLVRWIGRWEGNPTSGSVEFFMTAEAEDAPADTYRILECDRPSRFAGETSMGWHLWFELAGSGDGTETILTFGHRLAPEDDIGSIGPGWEYYLDRLVTAQAGADTSTIAWDDYYPVLEPEYERLVVGG